ncbi:hypothetical protein [Lactovum odontotermitis]
MKKRTIIIIVSILIPILIIGGIIGGFKMNEQQTKDRQIAFLKEHEQAMLEYVQIQTHVDERITFDFNGISATNPGTFNPDMLILKFSFDTETGQASSPGRLRIQVDDIDNPSEIVQLMLLGSINN